MSEQQSRWTLPPGWHRAVTVILLILFGALEAEALLNRDAVDEALAGLGILGSLILLFLRR